MLIFGLGDSGGTIDPLLILLLALAMEACVGEASSLFQTALHPVRVIGGLIGFLDRTLNREGLSPATRIALGALAVALVIVLAGAVGWAVTWLTSHFVLAWIIEFVLTVTLLAQRSLYDHVRAVGGALKTGGLEGGRRAVAHIVGRDVDQLDRHGVARAAIESCAENFSDAVVAPVFWYVLFGFPGLLVYKSVNTLDSMIGYTSPRHKSFGLVAARLDDLLNLVPARLAGLFLVAAAGVVPSGDSSGAWRAMRRDAGKHRSPNAGWPEAAMAGALGLALGGPRRYGETTVDDPWIGDGRTRATGQDIEAALSIYVAACLINALVVAVLAFL